MGSESRLVPPAGRRQPLHTLRFTNLATAALLLGAPGAGRRQRAARGDLTSFAQAPPPNPGRFGATANPADRRAFRTPMLRDVARSAPYMHDGSLASPEEVVDFYAQGGGTAEGQSALLAFLRALDAVGPPAPGGRRLRCPTNCCVRQ